MTTIYLCQVQEIDSTYQNVLHFNSRSQQLAFFNSRVVKVVNAHNLKPDDMRSEITLNSGYSHELNSCDYLFFEGKNGSYYFYFIDNLEYVTDQSTKAYVTLDVWSTHHLNLTIHKSFVEQMHVPRWKGNGIPMEGEIYDEGFPQYQAQLKEMRRVEELDGVYVYASTMPLGTGIVSGTGGGGGCQSNGVPSKQGFRFIKGYEAFSDYGLYLNGETFKTVGYGFTERHNLEVYNQHKPFPCSEQLASELFGHYLIESYASRVWKALENVGVSELITYHMFDAMCSLAWNRGVNGFLNDDTSPFQLIRVNPLDPSIKECWEKYAITSNGNVLNGLVARRQAERNIYCNGEYEKRPIIQYTDNGHGLGIAMTNGVVTDYNGDGFIPPQFKDCQTKTYDMVDGDGNGWSYPTTGTITATYPDYSDETFHGGVDFANTLNTPIKAIANGTVVAKNTSTTGYGNHLVVEHIGQNGVAYHVWYAHLNEFAVNTHVGNTVNQGEVIGLMGSSGNSTGSHLHLEIRKPPYKSGSYNVIHSSPLYSVGDTIHPNIKLKVGDVIG